MGVTSCQSPCPESETPSVTERQAGRRQPAHGAAQRCPADRLISTQRNRPYLRALLCTYALTCHDPPPPLADDRIRREQQADPLFIIRYGKFAGQPICSREEEGHTDEQWHVDLGPCWEAPRPKVPCTMTLLLRPPCLLCMVVRVVRQICHCARAVYLVCRCL